MDEIKLAPLAKAEYGAEPDSFTPANSPRRVPKELRCLGNLDQLTLSWSNLNVFIPPKKRLCRSSKTGSAPEKSRSQSKQILSDVTGLVRSGQCMALMGASGAGKTTLLNTLNGRNRAKIQMDGVITINGRRISPGGITAISAYVQQVDLFLPTIKVREHLRFHAALRMDPDIPYAERMKRVEEVITDLGLTKCADSFIGGPHRKGISGGEMKRLAFACEVLTDPPLLFCDEPTTGLDAFMAQTVVEVMQSLAKRGKTVLCTIHQPSSEVFALFDQLLLLAEGRLAYIGPREAAPMFFAKIIGMPVPEDYNPADFYINTLAIVPGKEEACRTNVANICNLFSTTNLNEEAAGEVRRQVFAAANQELVVGQQGTTTYKATWAQQMRAVLGRSALTMWREPMLFRVRMFQMVCLGLLFGFIYYGQTMTTEGVMNINGILYMFLMQMTMGNVFAVVSTQTGELPILLKEHLSGMYRLDVYYICRILVDIPVFMLLPFVFVVIVYFTAGLFPSATAFVMCWIICALVAQVAVSFGSISACAFPTTQAALAVGMTLLLPLTLFGGLFMSLNSIPVWLKWIEYISWFRYANEALAVNQWSGVERITCTTGGNFSCPSTGQEVLDTMGFDSSEYNMDIGILIAMIFAFRSIAYTVLYFRAKP